MAGEGREEEGVGRVRWNDDGWEDFGATDGAQALSSERS